MTIEVITCEDYIDHDCPSKGKTTFISHGVDVDTGQVIVMQSERLDYYILNGWIKHTTDHGYILI